MDAAGMSGTTQQHDSLLVRVCSWNIGEEPPEGVDIGLLREWIFGAKREGEYGIDRDLNQPDVIAIGFQEVDMSFGACCWGWWIPFGCGSVCHGRTKNGQLWKEKLEEVLSAYSMIDHQQLMGMHLTIWWRQDFAASRDISKEVLTNSSGFFGIGPNKGGICARFKIRRRSMSEKSVALCFVNVHYAAKLKNLARRNQDHQQILDKIHFKEHPHKILDHEYVFWFGDMNYRLLRVGVGDDVMKQLKSEDNIDKDSKDEVMCRYDQLYSQMADPEVRLFSFFTEPKITWGPTYKLLKNAHGHYDGRRNPSYCDRILYYSYVHHKQRDKKHQSTHELPLLSEDDVEMADDEENPLSSPATPGSPRRGHLRRPAPYLFQWKQSLGEEVPSLTSPVNCLEYATCIDPGPSDHRPVYSLFYLPHWQQGGTADPSLAF
eukprot:TRINITY_DN18469_c0_g1_i1.p1 TRINITY_DN18469_c0_g1~~TRINITY_DN18469_c0_g1_i1.p1  ORF type:complete len:432 (+),score=162.67 TRINITY_DN18469_c0_g1_i1:92-1387(+)